MQQPLSYGTILVIVVAALSLVAGLVVVIITSPESIRLGQQQQIAQSATTALPATVSTATVVLIAETPTAASTESSNVSSTSTVVVTNTALATATLLLTETPVSTATITPTAFPTLAPDAIGIGRIITSNNSTARLRSLPSLEGKVVGAVPAGDYVQVLGKPTKADDILWLPVRLNNGLTGWVADALVVSIATPQP